MSHKSKLGQHLGNEHSGRLLTVHTDGQCLCPAEEQEGIERRQSIADCVNDERDILHVRIVPLADLYY